MNSSVEKISVALPAEMVATLKRAVASGEYASSSEVVREARRAWSHQRALQQHGLTELRALWQEALRDKSAAGSGSTP